MGNTTNSTIMAFIVKYISAKKKKHSLQTQQEELQIWLSFEVCENDLNKTKKEEYWNVLVISDRPIYTLAKNKLK